MDIDNLLTRTIHELPITKEDLGKSPRFDSQYLYSIFEMNKFEWNRLAEIKCILDSGMIRSALILALTIPDVCSKIEYPEFSKGSDSSTRYEKWFDEQVLQYNIGAVGEGNKQFDCFNGFMCYKLRCRMVHGDPTPIEEIPNQSESSLRKAGYDKVIFRFTSAKESQFFDITGEKKIAVFFKSIPQLVMQIISNAEACYENEPEKSKFQDSFELVYPI